MKKISPKREERAKPSRMQVFRMARIVALLKKNRLPGAETLLKEYEKLEFEENQLIRAKYSLRTVYRDIDSLKNDFRCPIEYDRAALTDCRIWVARYDAPVWKEAEFPDGNDSYDAWQYSNTGSVPGIEGNVDLDVFYFPVFRSAI